MLKKFLVEIIKFGEVRFFYFGLMDFRILIFNLCCVNFYFFYLYIRIILCMIYLNELEIVLILVEVWLLGMYIYILYIFFYGR